MIVLLALFALVFFLLIWWMEDLTELWIAVVILVPILQAVF